MKPLPGLMAQYRPAIKILTVFFLLATAIATNAQSVKILTARELKRLSVEELINIEVTSVSRMPQKLTEVASALQVITGAEIQRSGATNIPDALRLLSNLQVSSYNSSAWIISSRGFNTIFANKLLVMIDGRSIYTPLFGGVIWELQNLVLEDVDRIEVVSGPGGTLWGANAVNGVINIITKKAKETLGTYASVSVGSMLKGNLEVRHGGRIGPKMFYRVYGQHFARGSSILPTGLHNNDDWHMTQGGFRLDWTGTPVNNFTVQGDFYGGARLTMPLASNSDGQNLLARWNHTFSPRSNMSLQFYYDRYYRNDVPSNGYDKMKTYDLDFQYSFPIRHRQNVLIGLSYRLSQDEAVYTTPAFGILPPKKNLVRYSGFVQDEIRLLDSLKLTIGTKVQHQFYAGFGLQPSGRLAWTFRNRSTLWGAVSKALRTASRVDVDYYLPAAPQPPNVASVAGGPNFVSEKVTAYELGYRIQPSNFASFSAAVFYNVYRDVYSVEPDPGTLTYRIQNGSEAKSWGLELSGNCQLTSSWKLRGGYTFFRKDLYAKPGHNFNPAYLGNDAENQAVLQSIVDITRRWHFDIAGRYVDYLPATFATALVKGYMDMDVRLAVDLKPVEIAVVGQNLLHAQHAEFNTFRIPRSVYVKISCRF